MITTTAEYRAKRAALQRAWRARRRGEPEPEAARPVVAAGTRRRRCVRCGATLNSYNDADTCFPCRRRIVGGNW